MEQRRPLQDAWHKIERAQKHIADADAAIKRPTHDQLYPEVLEHDFDAETEANYITPVWHEALTEANCAIGDAIHNLRSALDAVAYALSVKMVPDLSSVERSRVTFPVYRSERGFRDPSQRAKIEMRFGSGMYGVFERFKPYDGGNKFLWALHRLDVIDKHHRLLAIGNVVTEFSDGGGFLGSSFFLNHSFLGGGMFIEQRSWQPFRKHIEISREPLNIAPQLQMDRRLSIHMAVGEIPALESYPVIGLLGEFVRVTESIVTWFEREFFPEADEAQ